jgi:hypothetical protein
LRFCFHFIAQMGKTKMAREKEKHDKKEKGLLE